MCVVEVPFLGVHLYWTNGAWVAEPRKFCVPIDLTSLYAASPSSAVKCYRPTIGVKHLPLNRIIAMAKKINLILSPVTQVAGLPGCFGCCNTAGLYAECSGLLSDWIRGVLDLSRLMLTTSCNQCDLSY